MLYFAPTPGASGFAEGLSTIVMSDVRPAGADSGLHAGLAFVLTWFTIGAGFVVFTVWVRRGLKAIEVPDP